MMLGLSVHVAYAVQLGASTMIDGVEVPNASSVIRSDETCVLVALRGKRALVSANGSHAWVDRDDVTIGPA